MAASARSFGSKFVVKEVHFGNFGPNFATVQHKCSRGSTLWQPLAIEEELCLGPYNSGGPHDCLGTPKM